MAKLIITFDFDNICPALARYMIDGKGSTPL
jgi:hypothetical protein